MSCNMCRNGLTALRRRCPNNCELTPDALDGLCWEVAHALGASPNDRQWQAARDLIEFAVEARKK